MSEVAIHILPCLNKASVLGSVSQVSKCETKMERPQFHVQHIHQSYLHYPYIVHLSSIAHPRFFSKPTYCKREYLYSCNVVSYIEDIYVISYAWKQISLGFHMHESNKILLNYIGITRVNIYKLSWWKSFSVITYASNDNNYLCMKKLYEKYYIDSYVLTYVWIK